MFLVTVIQVIEKLVDIRSGEYRKTVLMFLYIFFLIASYVTIKAVRDALFLNKLGSAQLPYVYILVGVIVGVVAWTYARLSARVSLHGLIHATLLVVVANLLLFWWLLRFGWPWLYYALYFWSSAVGILTTAQFWLLANHVFNAREAKALFGVIGAGAIAGGIGGGVLTAGVVGLVGTEALLLLSGVGYLFCSGVVRLLGRRAMPPAQRIEPPSGITVGTQKASTRSKSILGTLRASRHLLTIVGLIGLVEIVETLVDYQFKVMAAESFPSKDALTAFMGTFSASLSAASFFFQLLLTGTILRNLGIALTLLVLPVSLLIGSLSILAVPGLVSASLTKLSEGGFRYSINKAGLEVLYLPLASEVKNRVKPFIDTVVDRVARGIGGFILLASIGVLSVAQISLISIGLLCVWILLALASQNEYLKSLREALQRRRMDLTSPVLNLSEPRTVELLTRALLDADEAGTLYALRLLERADVTPYVPALTKLTERHASAVRSAAVRLLAETRNPDLLPVMAKMITDEEIQIRVEAMRFVCARKGCPDDLLAEWLASTDPRIVGGAIVCALNHPEEDLQKKGEQSLRWLIRNNGARELEGRLEAAKALGWLPSGAAVREALARLLHEEAPEVVKAALKSAGGLQEREVLPIILGLLDLKQFRGDAKATLVRYGQQILPTLAGHLEDAREPIGLRCSLPRVIAEIGGDEAASLLLRNLDQADRLLRYQVVKGLNKIRAKNPAFRFDPNLINPRLIQEIRYHYELLAMLYDPLLAGEGSGARLLRRAVRERLDHNLKMIFRLLGLRFPIKDIHNAYYGVTADDPLNRANAVEFLDTLLPVPLKHFLVPILEERSPETVLEAGKRFLSIQWPLREQVYTDLLRGPDSWLKACFLYMVAEQQLAAFIPDLRQALSETDPLVRETAQVVVERLEFSRVERLQVE